MFFISFHAAALLALACTSSASRNHSNQTVLKGFNSGNTLTDVTPKNYSDFLEEFQTQRSLSDAPGFNVVRLYTNIQASPSRPSEPLSAFKAAIDTNTKLLLGVWASGTTNITFELDALSEALDTYGSTFADLVVGISVGTTPSQIVKFIRDTRERIAGTLLADKPVGHVDTWTSWTNISNSEVIDTVDWVGTDIYPFYEKGTEVTPHNLINKYENAVSIFKGLWERTIKAAKGKPVWVTETGWPFADTKEESYGKATASPEHQAGYWRSVGCELLFDKVNTFWYTFRDANSAEVRKFGIIHDEGGIIGEPRFNLSCGC